MRKRNKKPMSIWFGGDGDHDYFTDELCDALQRRVEESWPQVRSILIVNFDGFAVPESFQFVVRWDGQREIQFLFAGVAEQDTDRLTEMMVRSVKMLGSDSPALEVWKDGVWDPAHPELVEQMKEEVIRSFPLNRKTDETWCRLRFSNKETLQNLFGPGWNKRIEPGTHKTEGSFNPEDGSIQIKLPEEWIKQFEKEEK